MSGLLSQSVQPQINPRDNSFTNGGGVSSSTSIGAGQALGAEANEYGGETIDETVVSATTEGPTRKRVKYKPFSRMLTCHHEGCPYTVNRPQFMATHLKYHECDRLGVRKIYKCSEEGCGYLATEFTNISGHRRVHAKSKPFVCGIDGCEHVSSHGNNMRSHQVRIHGWSKSSSANRADSEPPTGFI
jgi:hypothetical protein